MAPSQDLAADYCFVHAADLHLDTPFSGVGETAPVVAAALREASLDAFDNLVDLCLDRHAAFLVIAGDIYDGADRGIRAQLRFRDGLGRLSDAGIATFVVHGNHDPVESGWSAVSAWPPLVTIFGSDTVEAVPVHRDGKLLAVVQGISYGRTDVSENLALRFAPAAGPGIHVGVLHCNVAGSTGGHEDYSPCSLQDLRRAGLDYWALGHIHARSVLSGRPYGEEPWVVYPGNLQARSPKASEQGAKGACVVAVCGGRVGSLEFVACDRIRYATIDVDLAPFISLDVLRDALTSAGRAEIARAGGRSVILRAHLSGRSELHGPLRAPRTLAELLASLRDDFTPSDPWAWWDRLEDASAPPIDLDDLRGGSDFAADLIAIAEEMAAACTEPAIVPGLEPSLPSDFLDDITSTLPKSLRARAMASELSAGELLAAGLMAALDELGAGETLNQAVS